MATTTKMSFQPVDAALTIVMMMSAFIVVGIASFDLFGVDFSATLTTIGGYGLSTAWVLAALALAGTIATNDNAEISSLSEDVQNLDQYYYGAIVATALLMVGWIVWPAVPSFFQSADLWGLVYVGITTTGQFALGWML